MTSNLTSIFTNLVNQLTKLEKIIKKTTIQEINFQDYLQQVKVTNHLIQKFQSDFNHRPLFQTLIQSQQTKHQLQKILKQRIQKLQKIPLARFDQEILKSNTNSSRASFDSDQSLRGLLKRQVMLLKVIQLRIIELQDKFNGNKQNHNQNININMDFKKLDSQYDDEILHNLIKENIKFDVIIKDNIKKTNIGLDLIKQITQIQEDLKQNIIYSYYQCLRKWELQTAKTIYNIKSIIQKFISVKPNPSPMFQMNTSYAISQNTLKRSVLTERIHKKTSENQVQKLIKDFKEQEIKTKLKKDFDLQGRKKEKKVIKNVVCYNGCNIF